MCGIAGMMNMQRPAGIDTRLLQHINRTQRHRGPDDEGYYCDQWVGLAHRRLSIIDLSGGHQPLFNEDQTIAIVFNGEIYNFKALAHELKSMGHEFRTLSDTEVIVHAWEEWGEACLSRFRGMFAFALWDSRKRALFLARDRLGKKPLFYTMSQKGQFIFASELKVLTAHPDVDLALRHELAEDYLMYGYIPDPHTAYRNIFKLPAGHTLTLHPGQVPVPVQYWDLPETTTTLTWPQIQESLLEKIKEAVSIRMVADVPLGAFLSGGVDSSAIVALMSQLNTGPVNTCAIGFDQAKFDETQYARLIAQQFQTQHQEQQVNTDDVSLVEVLAQLYDEPFADDSALPTYLVCKLARQNVTVALSGDGGDEIFAGYRRYRFHLAEQKVRGLLPSPIRQPLFGLLGQVYPKADWAPRVFRAKTTLQSLALDSVDAYANTISKIRYQDRQSLFSAAYRHSLSGYTGAEILRQHALNTPTDDPLKFIQYLDFKTWLPGDILTKVDRASMANSLEVRAPLLDHRLIEWAFQIESQDNIRRQTGKYGFKKVLEPLLPQAILYRPKMGFSLPLSHWFRHQLQPLLHEQVLSPVMMDSGYFEPRQLQKLVTEHVSGRGDHGAALWSLLMFAQFLSRQA
ncbi:XrtA/PEP-CTERM system amidotransferase [Photobacterium sp. 1_MG-2023]|uniref:XrtA/PEP-CTERM system amidotransferase n=1 Tax=Photobacterium sp. 1_MG-2023 TaxID=3062646 RepID=UPI0026E17346|nr:XrtA/PEP-CTERM system amidotransferase [Photobacterium sp. 1_MG-2023]MDO6705897.1 amidotransferase 1, exosortase A system-associated [Photobacterium sp. 1_MG-2023]